MEAPPREPTPDLDWAEQGGVQEVWTFLDGFCHEASTRLRKDCLRGVGRRQSPHKARPRQQCAGLTLPLVEGRTDGHGLYPGAGGGSPSGR